MPLLAENNFQTPLLFGAPRLLIFRLSVGPLLLLRPPPYYLELESICLPEKPCCTSSECYISLKVVHFVTEFNFHKLRRLLRSPLKSTSTLIEVYLKVVGYGFFYTNFFELYFRRDSNITVHSDSYF